MKAIVCRKYGPVDVLKLEEVPAPVPGDNEVLVEVRASSVNFNALAFVSGEPRLARLWTGLSGPRHRIPGNDLAGRVEAVGRNVKRLRPGDEVFGDSSGCGFGAFAEYACVPEAALALKPTCLTFEQAAVVPEAAVVALQGLLHKGRIEAGQDVLIYGASGGIGTFAVQIAKSFGARVTGVCSTANLAMVRSLGADRVIDYTKEDFAGNGHRYDLILATAGYRWILDYRRVLTPRGTYVATGGSMQGPRAMAQIFQGLLLGPWISMVGGRKMGTLSMKPDSGDLVFVKGLIDTGKVKPVVDRTYPLEEAVEALRYYAKGHSRGKVAISVRGRRGPQYDCVEPVVRMSVPTAP